ncbi:transmembrane channel-like protein 7 isoform X2 [Oncorhynchus mykiss]|uniref:transmembrane channel-like protein 7 isoform X2 n=1 Tax=Oncorhynchus mykiss TaxID=8022 RepID=UPI001878160B|nr:transmembrane channel-like protein 7 isoform X2 [Oncorhynchus mykiss]
MEDKECNSGGFMRLISEESCSSTVTDELCVNNYQTEIFNQLPSSLARRRSLHHYQDRGTTETSHPVEKYPGLVGEARDKATTQPIRSLPVCMQRKREARDLRHLQTRTVGRWESWKRNQSINRKRLGEQVDEAMARLLPWSSTLHTIEGLLRFEGNDSVLDFFVGSGFLERSPVFYGFYARSSLDLLCLNTPLLFLLGTLTVLILSLVMVVRRTVVGYKHTWLLGNRYNIHMSYKVFCGWDFCIQDPEVADLKLSFIRNELKLYLEEERFQQREARRTLGQWAHLYSLRGLLHLLVLVLLGGAFCLIYYATMASKAERSGDYLILRLLLHYLPPIVITLVNFFLPHVFRHISSFEDYSLTTQVNATLVRSIFLKLASLGMYLFFLFKNSQQECWENQFGKEMYKLSVFDFLACFCNTFFIVYPRKWFVDRYPSSWLARLSGKQHFLIPFNVLDLVYSQTVTWVGLFYCPMLPFIETVKLMAVFYIKKLTVLQCCVPAQRMFRASSSSVLFHFMLLLGLIMAVITLGSNLHQFEPSSSCGPFVGSATVFNVTAVCVDSLPGPAQSTLRYLSSEAFVLPLILAQIVVLTSFESRRRANGKAIERLKDMLVMSTSDKHFLLKQHTLSLRRQKKTFKAPPTVSGTREGSPTTMKDPSAGIGEDSHIAQLKDPSAQPTGNDSPS